MQRDPRLQAVLDKLTKAIQEDTLPQSVAWTVIHRKRTDLPSARWSTGNLFLMLLAGTADARGIRQWNAVGRRVKQGARAFYILGPVRKLVTRRVTDPNTGEEKEEQVSLLLGFTPIPVFRVEDTEGAPLEVPDYTPPVLPPLIEVAQAWGIQVRYLPKEARYYGYYRYAGPGREEIVLCSHDEDIWFHELAHAAHQRVLGRPLESGQNPRQERVAALAAAVLAELYGYRLAVRRNVEYAGAYSEARTTEGRLRAILGTLDEAARVVELILQEAENLAAATVAA